MRCSLEMPHDGPVLDAAVVAPSLSTTFAATAGADGVVTLWNCLRAEGSGPGSAFFSAQARDGEPGARRAAVVARLRGEHARAVTAVAVSSSGEAVASAGKDRPVVLWDVERQTASRRMYGHDGMHTSLVAMQGGGRRDPLFASAGTDGAVCVWDGRARGSHRPVQRLLGSPDTVARLAFSPRTLCVAAACLDGSARLFDIRRGGLLAVTPGAGAARAVALGPLGELLAASCGPGPGGSGSVVVVDCKRRTEARRLGGVTLDDSPTSACIGPTGRLVWAASATGEAVAWDLDTGAERQRLAAGRQGSALTSLCAHPDAARPGGDLVVTAGLDGVGRVWVAGT